MYLLHARLRKELDIFSVCICFLIVMFLVCFMCFYSRVRRTCYVFFFIYGALILTNLID